MTHTTARFAGLTAIAERAATISAAKARGPGFFARVAAVLRARRERRAEAAIARLIRHNGGVLTDELERRIARVYGCMAGDRWL